MAPRRSPAGEGALVSRRTWLALYRLLDGLERRCRRVDTLHHAVNAVVHGVSRSGGHYEVRLGGRAGPAGRTVSLSTALKTGLFTAAPVGWYLVTGVWRLFTRICSPAG